MTMKNGNRYEKIEQWNKLVQQVKDRLDIVKVVSEQVALKKRGSYYWGLCPFHKEKTPSFSVTPSLGIYKCFGCGEGGDALSFIMKTKNIEFKDLILELAEKFELEVPQKYNKRFWNQRRKIEILDTITWKFI